MIVVCHDLPLATRKSQIATSNNADELEQHFHFPLSGRPVSFRVRVREIRDELGLIFIVWPNLTESYQSKGVAIRLNAKIHLIEPKTRFSTSNQSTWLHHHDSLARPKVASYLSKCESEWEFLGLIYGLATLSFWNVQGMTWHESPLNVSKLELSEYYWRNAD